MLIGHNYQTIDIPSIIDEESQFFELFLHHFLEALHVGLEHGSGDLILTLQSDEKLMGVVGEVVGQVCLSGESMVEIFEFFAELVCSGARFIAITLVGCDCVN
jgi:hypothetical protein